MGSLAHSPTPWERFTDRSRVPVRSSRRPQGRAAGEEEAAQGPRVEAPPLQLALRQRYDPAGWQAGPAEQAAARKVGLIHHNPSSRPPCCYHTLVFSLFSVLAFRIDRLELGQEEFFLGARGEGRR